MKISNLSLRNFRNHKNASFEFADGINLITGKNGAGKTNILEAIYIISGAKSQRVKYDRDLIHFNETFSVIQGNIENNSENDSIEIQIISNPNFEHMSSKKAKLNKVTKTVSAVTGVFTSVLFSPQDINIITGPPSDRRKFLDSILSVSSQIYKRSLDSYTKAVRQRNKVLEMILVTGNGEDQMDFWDTRILEEGKKLQKARENLIDFFNERINAKGTRNNGEIEIKYTPNLMTEERLQKHREHEISSKTTLVGPHRDDFLLLLEGKNLSEFGSRGQQREAMLGLRMCEIEYLEREKKDKPVLLLDDIFSEFDQHHQETVMNVVEGYQTIITNTHEPDFIPENSNRIRL